MLKVLRGAGTGGGRYGDSVSGYRLVGEPGAVGEVESGGFPALSSGTAGPPGGLPGAMLPAVLPVVVPFDDPVLTVVVLPDVEDP